MKERKIDRVELNRRLRAGKSQREIAEYFGVSEAAVSKARKELNINVVKSVTLEDGHKVLQEGLDAAQQLHVINEKALHMLDELTGENRIIDRMVRAVEGALQFEDEPQKQADYIRKTVKRISQDRALALKAMQEIRGQLSLQLDIFKTMSDMESVKEFQLEVLNAIREESPQTATRIIQRLKADKALRASVKITE